MTGTLYLVSIPIGNKDDLTLRAREILSSVDFVIGGEGDTTDRFLKSLTISKEIMLLNEHNEDREVQRIIGMLVLGESAALISDCGTPVFADPGRSLVQDAIVHEIPVVPVPGASSLLAGLTVCGFPIHKWYYRGFLSPKREVRRNELSALRDEKCTTVIMETPYRLHQMLEDMEEILGSERNVALCWQLTGPDEIIIRGDMRSVIEQTRAKGLGKGEFVIVLNGVPEPGKHVLKQPAYTIE